MLYYNNINMEQGRSPDSAQQILYFVATKKVPDPYQQCCGLKPFLTGSTFTKRSDLDPTVFLMLEQR